MISTSYGVRFFFFAAARSTFAQFDSKCSIWSSTSCALVVFGVNSYVAGKRKPSILPFAYFRNVGGTGAVVEAFA